MYLATSVSRRDAVLCRRLRVDIKKGQQPVEDKIELPEKRLEPQPLPLHLVRYA